MNPTTAATQIQALVAVMHASAASRAATFIRPRTAARAPAVSSAVSSGSTTADPDVNRKTGLSASSATASRAWRAFGARAYTQARVTSPSKAPSDFNAPSCHSPNVRSTAAASTW